MRTSFCLFLLIAFSTTVKAQDTRTEVLHPSTAVDDAKANSASVPDGYAVPGNFKNILIMRFKYQTDLLAGIDSLARQEKIRNAVILAGIGSVRGYCFHTVGNRTFPSKDVFVSNPESPADIASMNGYVVDGRVHVHVTFSDGTRAFGGHLEKGTSVFTFAIVTVGVLNDDIDIKRVDDKTFR